MRLKDTGLTAAELKAQVKKYMIETYERMDFVADYAMNISSQQGQTRARAKGKVLSFLAISQNSASAIPNTGTSNK